MTHTVKSRLEPPNHRRVHRAAGLGRKPPILALLGVALLLIAFPSVANAAAGALDPSFSGDGIAIDPSPGSDRSSVAVDSSGRIVVLANYYVLRFLPNGTLDRSFSGDGRADLPFEGAANSVAIDAQDRVVVGGYSQTPGAPCCRHTFAVGRLKANGTPDPSFSGDGWVATPIGGLANDEVTAVALDPQGRIVAAGFAYKHPSGTNFALARYLANGSPDHSFSGDGQTQTHFPDATDAQGQAVAIDSRGRIVMAGLTFSNVDNGRFAVARYGPGGGLDRSFSNDGTLTTAIGPMSSAANSVAVDDSDRIVVGGLANQGDNSHYQFALARYARNGTLDATFSGDGKVLTSFGRERGICYGVAIDDHQRIVAGGWTFDIDNGRSAFALSRYTPGGALDPAFSGDGRVTTSIGPHSEGTGVALDPQGRIVVAGSTSQANLAGPHTAVARYLSR